MRRAGQSRRGRERGTPTGRAAVGSGLLPPPAIPLASEWLDLSLCVCPWRAVPRLSRRILNFLGSVEEGTGPRRLGHAGPV